MPDAPSAADATASLQIAKQSGGQAFLSEHARLTAAGAIIGPQDQELYAQLQSFRQNINPALPAGPSDQRSAEQRQFDEAHGYAFDTDGRQYHVSVPAPLQDKNIGSTIEAARQIASALSLGTDQGNNFLADAFRTITKLEAMSPDDRQAQKELWIKQSRAVWGDDALEQISKDIDSYLTATFPNGNRLLERLSNAGGLVAPEMVAALRHSMVAHNTRPR